jgi:hypothetical protein
MKEPSEIREVPTAAGATLDESLDRIDPERLSGILHSDAQRLSPPFYNCFSNTFANSPNFAKRLARTFDETSRAERPSRETTIRE